MDEPIEQLTPPIEPPGRSWLSVLVLTIVGIGLGAAAAVGFLLWWDHNRWQQWEQDRLEALAEIDRRAQAAKERETLTAAGDHLTQFNDQFREIYRTVRAEALALATPLVVVSGDELVLHHKNQRQAVFYLPAAYHELKAYAHLPLAAYLVTGLEPGNTDFPTSRQLEMKKLLERLPDIRDELKRRNYTPEVMARQEKLIDTTRTFLEECHKRAYENKPIDTKERSDFAWSLNAPIEENLREAARLQIEALDKQIAKWRANLSDADWKKLRVVVIGSALPRRDNVAVQYFAWLLGESGESDRIVYAEGLFEETRAMNLVGTRLVDRDVGRQFFREPSRMERDLLGDAARKVLESLPPPGSVP